jgi:serine/threonine protein kinase
LPSANRSPVKDCGLFGCGSPSALSAALGRLHQRGLVHKDFKPTNFIVNSATAQAWLTSFGIASRLQRERQAPEPPEFIAGTLPYMAPEQTGRMNRSIDSRSPRRTILGRLRIPHGRGLSVHPQQDDAS